MTTIVPTVDQVGDATLTNSIIDKSITILQDEFVTELPDNVFESCTALNKVVFGSVRGVGNYAFGNCSALKIADFHADNISISSNAFYNCSALSALILRDSTLSALDNANAFQNTGIANGTGYIYVPSALVDSYKTAANWVAYTNQFKAIEDYPALCSDFGKVWTELPTFLHHITFDNELYVGAGTGLFYSEDGTTWHKSNAVETSFGKPIYANGMWVAASEYYGLWYSVDGKAWTQTTSSLSYPTDVAYGDDKWLCAARDSSYNGLIYESADGMTWNLVDATNAPRASYMTYYNGVWIAVGYYCGIRTSEDGSVWTTITSNRINTPCQQGNGIIACTDESNNVYYSTDGKKWDSSRPKDADILSYANGMFFAGGYGEIYSSVDCKQWQLHSTIAGIYAGAVAYVEGIWVMCSYANNKGAYFSLDGATWELSNIPTVMSQTNRPCFQYRDGLLLLSTSKGSYYSRL